MCLHIIQHNSRTPGALSAKFDAFICLNISKGRKTLRCLCLPFMHPGGMGGKGTTGNND